MRSRLLEDSEQRFIRADFEHFAASPLSIEELGEYAATRETKELWPMILEKAYAGFDVTSDSNPTTLFARLQRVTAGGGCGVGVEAGHDDGFVTAKP